MQRRVPALRKQPRCSVKRCAQSSDGTRRSKKISSGLPRIGELPNNVAQKNIVEQGSIPMCTTLCWVTRLGRRWKFLNLPGCFPAEVLSNPRGSILFFYYFQY